MLKRIGLMLCVIVGLTVIWSAADTSAEESTDSELCGTCHIHDKEVSSMSDLSMLGQLHNDFGRDCTDCHQLTQQDYIDRIIAQITGDFRDPLRPIRVDNDFCLGCHVHDNYDDLVQRTKYVGVRDEITGEMPANPHASHFPDLNCRTCHKMHTESEDYCGGSGCHVFEWVIP